MTFTHTVQEHTEQVLWKNESNKMANQIKYIFPLIKLFEMK